MNYKLIIQYDGTRYNGWQRLGDTGDTIQGKLESVLSRLAGEPVEVHGAGRTDAGVHALGQTASVRLPGDREPAELLACCARYLPEDIAVIAAGRAEERFHARLNAVGKEYRYELRLGPVPDVFRRKYQYHLPGDLDTAAMERAAAYLTGRHDFRSFCANRRYKKSTVRTVSAIELDRRGDDLTLIFRGDGFLHHMVRILTGTLIEVGQGKRAPEDMPAILAAGDRAAAGFTAPAQGLTLARVDY